MSGPFAAAADLSMLQRRAQLLRAIREFFFERGVTEVVTPVLGDAGVTDPHIENVVLGHDAGDYYLQTSPEHMMKRLLASGAGAIFQMGPVFRGGESGAHHNIEFTMLEWYRPGFDLHELAAEVNGLMQVLFAEFGCAASILAELRYKDLFTDKYGMNPHSAGIEQLRSTARRMFDAGTAHIAPIGDDGERNDYLDLMFSRGIETSLEDASLVFEYPASQAALAEVVEDEDGDAVSNRFEMIWKGIELANGYQELRDAEELQHRMAANNAIRRARGLPEVAPDARLLAALPHMPPCSGVAVGIDRLLMLLTGKSSLDQVLAFRKGRG